MTFQQENKSDAQRLRRRSLALGASLALHIALLAALFGGVQGEIVSGASSGGYQEQTFDVLLVGPAAVAQASRSEASASAELTPLFAKFRVAVAPDAAPVVTGERATQFAALARKLQARVPAGRLDTPSETQGDASQTRISKASADAHAKRDGDGPAKADRREGATEAASGGAGNLWGAVEPCWRRISSRVRSSIVLEVTLNSKGQLGRPPKVLRQADADSDQQRLRAEAAALAALAACLPHNDLRYAGRSYRLEFRPTS